MSMYSFSDRHNGPKSSEIVAMLEAVGVSSIDALIDKTVPSSIRLKKPLKVSESRTEFEYLSHLRTLAAKNKLYKNFIGQGYFGTITPSVIQRNVLENPGWYTAYTPYQAEIAQGRLEALLNFQTMVMDLTAMPVANASLLDEATAGAEAMSMFYNNRTKEQQKSAARRFYVSPGVYQQTLDVIKTRSAPMGIECVLGSPEEAVQDPLCYGVLIQYPNAQGQIENHLKLSEALRAKNIQLAVATDLMALALLSPPGEWGADCVFGNSQRFGVPMGYGGPHAAFFACRETYKRHLPGRIIGVSVDADGNPALRMALQTREQHIKRDKATSNICTAQALLAIMASMYAVYHGPQGISAIAKEIHQKTQQLAASLQQLGYSLLSPHFFDTLTLNAPNLRPLAESAELNFHYPNPQSVQISIDETTTQQDLEAIVAVFASLKGLTPPSVSVKPAEEALLCKRTSVFLQHPVFNQYHSESEMMRYIKRLENKDLSLVHSMISLGSCTMKLNAATELLPITWPAFANLHPFVPADQAQGFHDMLEVLNRDLCEITGFAKMSFQPNSGAQGEYAGLMVIRAYHQSRGDMQRNVALIPSSAHGTNPASAAMAGMHIVVVSCDEQGNIDVADLKAKAELHQNELSCLMITYPSTHGVYEESVIEITKCIHQHGGLVYMDGANMNAQVGLTSPGSIGADVCHLNLHKTFAIPHGGGGPGMGPIGVAPHLVSFLPGHFTQNESHNAVSGAPFGSTLILLISYAYIQMLGETGLRSATEMAILNANYMKVRLQDHYPILYTGKNGFCAHEFILDCNRFKATSGVEVADIAKRLMDYGFHAPTVAFPVVNTLMIEPTESESKAELDRFCDAMISIRAEIQEIENGQFDQTQNVIKEAPHTAFMLSSDTWKLPYSRSKAAYPLPYLRERKFWPSVRRVDNAYGDRNLVCSCLPIESYVQ